MVDKHWQKIREVFDSALQQNPEERQDYINRACGDDKTLLHEVTSLFSSFDKSQSFMEAPAIAAVADIIVDKTDALRSGTHFGHYEIINQIGRGGMGTVYLARDQKLDRLVAIKMLNEEFSGDKSNLIRFSREAKTASALNHPNILVIHEIGESVHAPYIVSEFISGKTLREVLKERSLELSEILDIAIQIGSALTVAHEAHLVHRDIKPENIMIRPDGYVKILDFGLAKLVKQEGKFFLGVNDLTTGQSHTGGGLILGTVKYMAPEQAKGERIDERADIFSLGVVIYEMIAGQTPFAGNTDSETFANLINARPLPLTRFVRNVPSELEQFVDRALKRNKDERYQTMKLLLKDVKRLQQNLSLEVKLERLPLANIKAARVQFEITNAERSKSTSEVKRNWSRRITQRKLLAAFCVAAIVLSGVTAVYHFSTRNQAVFTLQLGRVVRLTTNGNSLYPAISPDGKFVAYILREAPNRLSIQLMNIATGSTKQIFAPVEYRDLVYPNFSPDGNFIYFAQSETYGNGPVRGLYRTAVPGGSASRLLIDCGYYTLSRDGGRIAFVRNSPSSNESYLMIANADGTNEYKLAVRKLSDPFNSLSWSSDGRAIAASVGSVEVSGRRMRLVNISLTDGTETEVSDFKWNFLGNLIWLQDRSGIIAIGRDEALFRNPLWFISYPDGKVQRLADDSYVWSTMSLTADSKTLAFQTAEVQTNIWITTVGDGVDSPAGQTQQITTGNDGHQVAYMPDGRLLFTSSNNRSTNDIWVMNADGSQRKQLTENAGTNVSPVASKDGRHIVFESDRSGKLNIWRMNADGGNPKQLTFGNNEKWPNISPDSKWVFYTSADDSTLWHVALEGGEPQQLTGNHWRSSVISPDGKWILSTYSEPKPDARLRIGLLTSDGGEQVRLFDIPPDIQINWGGQWTQDGRAFVFVGSRDGVFNIWRQPIHGGKPVQLTDFKLTDQIYSPNWSPDGKQIVFSRGGWTFDIFLTSISPGELVDR